jgi:hypothetical protein
MGPDSGRHCYGILRGPFDDRRPGSSLCRVAHQWPLPGIGVHGELARSAWNEVIGLEVWDINPLRKELTFGRVVVNQHGNTTFIEKMSRTKNARTLPVPGPGYEMSGGVGGVTR